MVKSLCFITTGLREIRSIANLMDTNSNSLNSDQLCTKHNFNSSKSGLTKLHKALPEEFVSLTKNITTQQPRVLQRPTAK